MSGNQIREEVLKLMQQKDRIEAEIKELTDVLTKNGVGMNDPLVDAEEFPISNIDVYQVRQARHRIICLQNDHKSLMKNIENGLHGYYSSTANSPVSTVPVPNIEVHQSNIIYKDPFAKISLVSPGSPAEYSGIEENDLIVEFGSINSTNFRDINDIAAVVQHSEGQPVHIKLKRGDHYVVTPLMPKKWSGKGLLGCNIVSLK